MRRDDLLMLSFRFRQGGGEWEEVEQPVGIVGVARHFGGEERYFVCPAVGCGRRVEKLFGAGKYFACRHCYRLSYRSQRERGIDRVISRMNQIRARLHSKPGGTMESIPIRPPYMRQERYERLRDELFTLEERAEGIMAATLDRLTRQVGPIEKRFWT
ncbi:MAG: hypothetical protein HQL72_04315 [Magnetococcales bacterium]|nr:hypothetical protein [Magnetococcales bacterium]